MSNTGINFRNSNMAPNVGSAPPIIEMTAINKRFKNEAEANFENMQEDSGKTTDKDKRAPSALNNNTYKLDEFDFENQTNTVQAKLEQKVNTNEGESYKDMGSLFGGSINKSKSNKSLHVDIQQIHSEKSIKMLINPSVDQKSSHKSNRVVPEVFADDEAENHNNSARNIGLNSQEQDEVPLVVGEIQDVVPESESNQITKTKFYNRGLLKSSSRVQTPSKDIEEEQDLVEAKFVKKASDIKKTYLSNERPDNQDDIDLK